VLSVTIRGLLGGLLLLVSFYAVAQTTPAGFDGVEKWQSSLTAADMASLKGLYSTAPPAKFIAKGQKPEPDISPETDFWQKLVSSGMTDFEVSPLEQGDKQGLHLVTLAVSDEDKNSGRYAEPLCDGAASLARAG
jgi:hypothetical protein